MDARRWDEGGEAGQELVRGEEQAAQALPALEVVGVDADAGVEREAVEADAMAGALEGFGEAQAPVYLGGLERGEGVGLRLDLVVEPDQQLGGPPDEAGQDPGQLLVARGSQLDRP
jgi:hypothetical protein